MLEPALTAEEKAALVVRGIIAVASLVGIWRSAACNRLLRQARAAMSAICSWNRRVVDDDVAAEVEKRIRKDKVDHLRIVCHVIGVFIFPTSVAHFHAVIRGQREILLREVATNLFKGICVATMWFPGKVSWYTIDAIYVSLALCCSVEMAAPAIAVDSGNGGFLAVLILLNVVFFAVSLARRDLYVVAPMSTLLALSTCLGIWASRGPALTYPLQMMGCQCVVLMFVIVCSHMLDEWLRTTIYDGLQMKAAKQLLAAATALLRSCCDMVIELGSDGTIMGPAQELGGFLLRGPNYSLQGRHVTDLMANEEDRRAFLNSLRTHREGGMSIAEAINVRMRDANSMVLSLQLLFFRFMYVDGSPRYMVGIRGDFPALGERVHGHELRGQDTPADGSPAPMPPPSIIGSANARQEEDVVSQLSDALPAVLVVDSGEGALRVRECSSGFRARVGHIPANADLRTALRDGGAFALWFSNAINSIANRMPLPADHKLTLFMPHGQVTAKCRVLKVDHWYDALRRDVGLSEWGGDEEDPGNEWLDPDNLHHIELLFSEIRHRLDMRHQPRWRLPSSLLSL